MNNEIKAEFLRDENGEIQTSIHKERLYSDESGEPVEIETVFAAVKITGNNKDSKDKILKIQIDEAQLNNAEYQKKFLQEVVYNRRLGWLDL